MHQICHRETMILNSMQFKNQIAVLIIVAAVPAVCHICLTWRVTNNHIKLSCKTDNLRFKVLFYDSHAREYGFCYFLFPESFCQAHYTNVSITQNLETNVTDLTLPKTSEYEQNVWTCRHGFKHEEATVKIKTNYINDLMGPEIRTNQAWPFEEGSIVELTCLALMQGQDVSLSWDCMNFTTKTQKKVNCSKISSMLVYMASVEDNGRICRCNAKTEFSILSTSLKLDIRRKVDLHVQNQFQCFNSDSVVIKCTVSGNPTTFGFDSWIHSLNGVSVRHINGDNNGYMSTINIKSCLFSDTGTYACRIWLSDRSNRKWIQRTSELTVRGPPIIVDTKTSTVPGLSLSASFLSLSKLFSSEWYLEHNLLRNLSEFDQITKNDTFTVQIYGVSVSMPGYSTTLSIQGVVPNYKTFSVVLLNELGNSSHSFSLRETKDLDGKTFPFKIIQWTVVAAGVFILVLITCSYLFVQYRRQNDIVWQSENANTSIYYAAPQIENESNAYNEIVHDFGETENNHEYFEIVSDEIETRQKRNENSSLQYMEMQ